MNGEMMDGMVSAMGWMMGLDLLGWVLVIALLVTILVVLVQIVKRSGSGEPPRSPRPPGTGPGEAHP